MSGSIIDFDAHALRVGRRHHRRARLVQDPRQIDRLDVQAQPAGDDARDVEHVLDDLLQRGRVALDDVERRLASCRAAASEAQHARVAEHGVERRAEFVRQRRQEFVLQPAGLVGALRTRAHFRPPATRARPARARTAGRLRRTRGPIRR